MQQTYFYYFKYFILGHVECGHKLQMGCWFWEVHVSFDQVLMKTRHATTSLRGRGGMPKATWSQSSERYYQQRLKLHFDQLADFSVWLCQWGLTRKFAQSGQLYCDLPKVPDVMSTIPSHDNIGHHIHSSIILFFLPMHDHRVSTNMDGWWFGLGTHLQRSPSTQKMMSVSVWRLHTSYLPGNLPFPTMYQLMN